MSAPAEPLPDRSRDLHVGPITRTQIVRFAGAGGDFNPMHHDEPFAEAAGQPSVFAMGQLSAALLARLARDWVGDARLRSLSVRFSDKVWPGDELELHGEVAEEIVGESGESGESGEPRWRCALTATRCGDGGIVARGELVASAAAVV